MLTISRKSGESFFIGDDIEVTISDIGFEKVKVMISAPKEIIILRKELKEVKEANIEAAAKINDAQVLKSIMRQVKKD